MSEELIGSIGTILFQGGLVLPPAAYFILNIRFTYASLAVIGRMEFLHLDRRFSAGVSNYYDWPDDLLKMHHRFVDYFLLSLSASLSWLLFIGIVIVFF